MDLNLSVSPPHQLQSSAASAKLLRIMGGGGQLETHRAEKIIFVLVITLYDIRAVEITAGNVSNVVKNIKNYFVICELWSMYYIIIYYTNVLQIYSIYIYIFWKDFLQWDNLIAFCISNNKQRVSIKNNFQ